VTGPWTLLADVRRRDRSGTRISGLRRRVHRLEEDIREDTQLTRLAERDLADLERTVGRLAEHTLRKGGS
jgi:hypothetical protein